MSNRSRHVPQHFLFVTTCALIALLFASLVAADARAQTLDELLDLVPPTTEEKTNEPTTEKEDATEAEQEQIELMSAAEAGDVFAQAIQEMDIAADRLTKASDPGIETQRIQKGVLDKLDQLIGQAKQQQQMSQSPSDSSGSTSQSQRQDQGSQGNAQRQDQADGTGNNLDARDESTASTGEGNGGTSTPEARARGALNENREEWGSLPPRLRDELMQGLNERYSSVYRAMTEAYYQRLAEEP